MRAVLFILILAVAALIVAMATGFLDISQTRQAEVPTVTATENGVVAQGGQTPAFDVETGSVTVGTRQANVAVPVPEVQVQPPAGEAESGNAQGPAADRGGEVR